MVGGQEGMWHEGDIPCFCCHSDMYAREGAGYSLILKGLVAVSVLPDMQGEELVIHLQ